MSLRPLSSETTALLQTLTTSLQNQGENSVEIDPAVLARAVQTLVANQLAAQQNQPQTAPTISQATAQHALTLPEGEYIGEIQDGMQHGRGILRYPQTEESSKEQHELIRKKYDGEWKNGKFHGNGVLEFWNGTRFEGQWENGKMHGKGLQLYFDGAKFEGDFVSGKRHGTGAWKDVNGDTYVGSYQNNKLNGQATYQSGTNENTYVGEWEDDMKHGYGKSINTQTTREGVYNKNHFVSGTVTGTYTGVTYTIQDGAKVESCCTDCTLF